LVTSALPWTPQHSRTPRSQLPRRPPTVDEIEQVRVEYLGRKSELKLALREVRDRETGMALNALREKLESAIDARQHALERAELDRRLTEERVDVTLPGKRVPRGHLHLITQIRREFEDIFLGLGYSIVDGREVETTTYNFDALNFPPGHPTRSPLQTLFPRRGDGAAHRDLAGADPNDGVPAAAGLRRLPGTGLSA
jgi:phenylalanyl-tRNA synthetase alpha chain